MGGEPKMRDARDGIAAAIKEGGYKQQFIAAKAGLKDMQLTDIIHKRRKMDANEMFRLCTALGITPNDLFADTEGSE
ncbi:MAG: helix-turn-helix transcriptional regulator [Oscillospiraceae bacterium]|nr:helix-turn-helix transcriptional regulator [Oscillospiraceae bacterium]